MTSWAEKYVDETVERAWLGLRMQLAERFHLGLEARFLEPFDIGTPRGDCLTVCLLDDEVVAEGGPRLVATANVDEAAYEITTILREDWHVLHPAFLGLDEAEPALVIDETEGADVPVLGVAGSREELQGWVETTLGQGLSHELRVRPNGDISWATRSGSPVVVSVRDQYWIEVWTVVAAEVGMGKARKMAQRLARRHPSTTFKLDQDRLVASRVLDAGPYVPRHLEDALAYQLQLADELAWVREKVLRKRARRAREERRRVVPAELMGLLPSANRIPSGVLAREVRARAASAEVLREWRAVARQQGREASRLGLGDADPHRVAYRLRMGWLRLGRAIDLAIASADRREDAA